MARRKQYGPRGEALWRSITGRFELAPHEEVMLGSACRHADMIERLEVLIAESLEVTGAAGQRRLSPAVGELRQCRLALSKLLSDLALPIDAAADDVKLASPASRRASKAARARHDRDRVRAVRTREGA